MGIPSYFSYIIKNFSNIICNYKNHMILKTTEDVDNKISLYMDCNSIIYDVYNSLDKDSILENDIENVIIENVIQKIKYYIDKVNPTRYAFIAFDGVAPFAKMEQQRTRRYKSKYSIDIEDKVLNKPNRPNKWNTSSITPGTLFMNMLSEKVSAHFYNENTSSIQMIISGSNYAGEGEHKMFQHIRENTFVDDTLYVYGLDSDLIMLSIFHCSIYCNNIYIFRESQEFSKNKPIECVSLPKELLFMNISLLSKSILNIMGFSDNNTFINDKYNRIYDYILLCFFLGNDFLPHFPSLNIRTTGIQVLLDTYNLYISKFIHERGFILKCGGVIDWKWVFVFIHELSKIEHNLLLTEYKTRDKMNNMKLPQTTIEDKQQLITNIPIIYRSEEKYICPTEPYWEDRYYYALFTNSNYSSINQCNYINEVCHNYLQGLEWVYYYYTIGCPHWRWKYKYHYPPLLCDLNEYIKNQIKPHENISFLKNIHGINRPFLPLVQLSYVIPKDYHSLIDNKMRDIITPYYLNYPVSYNYQWAFCRYFWESHVVLPEISVEQLELWETQYIDNTGIIS